MKKISFATLLPILAIGLFLGGRYIYFLPKYNSGEKAPAFSAMTHQGTEVSLESLEGNFVLIDFWGSWCGPCRAEVPGMKAIYNKYRNTTFANGERFEIVGVGIERKESSWRNAIDKLDLDWNYHILDLSTNMKFFNSEIATLYGIKELPTKYLLNPKGEIIGVNPSLEEIDKLLQKAM